VASLTQDIDVIHDPKASAMLEGLRLDPARHEVLPEGEWLKAAKRATGRNTLLGVPMSWIQMRCVPQAEMAKRILHKMKETSYRRRQATASSEDELKETQKWLRHSGMEDIARHMETQPYVGKEEGGMKYEQARQELNMMAKVSG